jgi:hypothetical protein
MIIKHLEKRAQACCMRLTSRLRYAAAAVAGGALWRTPVPLLHDQGKWRVLFNEDVQQERKRTQKEKKTSQEWGSANRIRFFREKRVNKREICRFSALLIFSISFIIYFFINDFVI